MKKTKFFKSVAIALICILCLSVAACNDGGGRKDPDPKTDPKPEKPEINISIGAGAPNEIKMGEQVTLTVTVTNTTNKKYTWSVTDSNGAVSDILTVSSDNVVTVAKAVTMDVIITVTATSDADNTKKASHTFTVKPNASGSVNNLTADMFKAISGPNLTVKGTVTDYFEDLSYSSNNEETVYNSIVMMDTNAWYGEFSAEGKNNPIISNYRAGKQYGNQGHQLMSTFINKNNELELRAETNYMSVPLIWENQHLWNHLGSLGVNISNKFTYDVQNDEYVYKIEPSGKYDIDFSPDEYLMTYLAVSLTPMLSENFMQFRLKVTDGAITGIWAQTNVQVAYASDGETVLQRAYTVAELEISDIGTTEVPNPAPFEAPEHVEYLQQVIDTMKTAKNYTFVAKETPVSSPSYDEGDYDMSSMSAYAAANIATKAQSGYYHKATSSKSPIGGTGTRGFVTEQAAIFETIGKYSASMDGQDYNFGYTGYRQFDGYFEVVDDEQVYMKVKGLIGVERRQGNFFEKAMPQFDFSPNVFEFIGSSIKVNGSQRVEVYDFCLRDPTITNEISREISAHDYADDGEAMAFSTLTISVAVKDGKATIYSTEFPYDVSFGTYTGFITTTYSDFGTTELLADAFTGDNYIERVYRDTWDKYVIHDFDADHSGNRSDENAIKVFQHMFGSDIDINKIPAPSIIMECLSDDINGPWFDFDDAKEQISFNCAMIKNDPRLDRNGRPIDIESLLGRDGELSKAILKTDGWTYSDANSGYRTPGNPNSSYFATYINSSLNMMLVVESNGTKNFFFDFYKLGEWSLSR